VSSEAEIAILCDFLPHSELLKGLRTRVSKGFIKVFAKGLAL
jgi:hypothetical protein